MRWDPYVLVQEADFDQFWRDHLGRTDRQLLLIVGRGFDSRALEGPHRIHAARAPAQVWFLNFDNGLEDSQRRKELTDKNETSMVSLFGANTISSLDIRIGGAGQRSATSQNTRKAISNGGDLSSFTDVIVDISAMPRMVALTTVAKLIHDLDQHQDRTGVAINLHVITAESVIADRNANSGSLSDYVTNVVGFSGSLTAQADEHIPRVWLPVLGEGQGDKLSRIREEVRPDEICPVIPFPSREPRRGDEIVGAHRQLLFDDFQVQPGNLVHACEYNPFEAYKQLFNTIDRYKSALRDLGGCKAFISPLSSKLLSVGVLLACYDHKSQRSSGDKLSIGIPYVETAAYSDPGPSENQESELYSLWIRGEWEL